MEKNRTCVELANEPTVEVTEGPQRAQGEPRTLADLELLLVGGGGNDTPLW
jgi:hypothetical protein